MTTETVDTSACAGRPLVVNGDSVGYARYELLIPNITTQAADSISAINVTVHGTAYTAIPTISFTGGGGSGLVAHALMNALTATVGNMGTGYAPGDTVTLGAGTGTAAIVTVSSTALVGLSLNAAGTGYTVGDTLTLVGGTHSVAATISVTTVGGSGQILTFAITAFGVYTVNSATFTATGGSGTGATFNSAAYGVNAATVTTSGSYSVLPAIPAVQGSTSGSGVGATFTMTYAVLSVVITNGGHDYVTAPTVIFSSGAAAATAVMAGADDPITVSLAFNNDLPTATYSIEGTASQAGVISYANKTVSGCDVTLTPLNGNTLVAGTMDVLLSFTS